MLNLIVRPFGNASIKAAFVRIFLSLFLAGFCSFGLAQTQLPKFLEEIDSVRTALKIPGMAIAIQQNDKILTETGFGYADVKNKITVTPTTSFRIASITKTFTSTIVMQLVENGKLDLQSPVSRYGLDLGNPSITVKNLFTHTSESLPGTHFQYNGARFGQLGPVIDQAADKPFFELLMENIIKPAGLTSTAPGISVLSYFHYVRDHKDMKSYFENAFYNLAKPYDLDNKNQIVETTYIDEFGAFGGLTTTVEDLLKYSSAIDRNQFVSVATQQMIFTPNRTRDGMQTPYGLGWFVQNWEGKDYYWHYGQTRGESGIFVKIPSDHLTLAVLTNSAWLSNPFPMGDGDLFMTPVGQLLYKYIINHDKNFSAINYTLPVAEIKPILIGQEKTRYRDFYNKEIVVQATLCNSRGDSAKAKQFYQLYATLNFKDNDLKIKGSVVASIEKVSVNQTVSKYFTLTTAAKLNVYGTGENCSADLSSWCDYGWIEDSTGKVVWQMQGRPARHAGGAIKNQHVEEEIDLPSGTYLLRYKSDGGHAFDSWDSLPPENFFWGIIVSK